MQRVRKNRATMYIRAEGNPDERRDEIVTREPGFLRTPNRKGGTDYPISPVILDKRIKVY